MTAVAVWERRPTARELLDARLADGWRPRPTPLKAGDRVLGFAACVFPEHRPPTPPPGPREGPLL